MLRLVCTTLTRDGRARAGLEAGREEVLTQHWVLTVCLPPRYSAHPPHFRSPPVALTPCGRGHFLLVTGCLCPTYLHWLGGPTLREEGEREEAEGTRGSKGRLLGCPGVTLMTHDPSLRAPILLVTSQPTPYSPPHCLGPVSIATLQPENQQIPGRKTFLHFSVSPEHPVAHLWLCARSSRETPTPWRSRGQPSHVAF